MIQLIRNHLHLPSLLFGLTLTTVIGVIGYIVLYEHHILHGESIEASHQTMLAELATQALPSRDVPVSTILLYNDSVIGSGYNTVNADSNAAGHAEINAISNAMKRMGVEAFKRLDRDSLLLLSTYEPCPMCKGAILEYNIRQVQYLKPKSLIEQIRRDLQKARYLIERDQAGREELQDSLFRLHPGYRLEKNE